ncbi:class I SAM-dependent methyltransferase [Bosea sp. 685]|uniref:class I SAM-dependent methyltransferase n=1 Tax=Bosea sp. 685 TaxID=3080057 RepID=UPI002892AB8F|nr:class I SAM-dependent methyltransferase [Bosea sp. 685]WNJ90046.1 class I SAM-dependent methyltransferase [Bosea sp. 685]
MDPQQSQTAKTFDSYKDTYSDAVDASVSFTGLSTDFFTKVKADYIIDVTRARQGVPKELSALDVGCGVGNYHSLLSPHFKALSGVDISPACVETARGRNATVDYKVYDGVTLPYETGTFDVAFTICVMHHVPPSQWQGFAREMHRVLKPGGLALIFEHNPRNPLTMRAVNQCPFDADAVLMRSETTEALYREAGFKDIVSRYILSVPPANGLLRRVDQLFARLPFGGQYYVAATA